jgi:hypothetical protein
MRLALVNGGGRCWMPSTQTVSEPALRISVPLFTMGHDVLGKLDRSQKHRPVAPWP